MWIQAQRMFFSIPLSSIFLHFLGSYDNFNFKSSSSGVKGHLSASIDFWKSTLHAPEFVLDTIRRGYRLPFAEYLPSCLLANDKLAFQHPEFVAQAISQLSTVLTVSLRGLDLSTKIFAPYLKSWRRGTGSLHRPSSQGIIMLISAWNIWAILHFLGSLMAC